MNGELTASQLRRLRDAHDTLRALTGEVDVPAVRAALVAAAGELRTAIDHQTLDFDFYGAGLDVADTVGPEEARRVAG